MFSLLSARGRGALGHAATLQRQALNLSFVPDSSVTDALAWASTRREIMDRKLVSALGGTAVPCLSIDTSRMSTADQRAHRQPSPHHSTCFGGDL